MTTSGIDPRLAGFEIQKQHWIYHNSPLPAPIMSQINPVNTLTINFWPSGMLRHNLNNACPKLRNIHS
jgi:hypothetical protein